MVVICVRFKNIDCTDVASNPLSTDDSEMMSNEPLKLDRDTTSSTLLFIDSNSPQHHLGLDEEPQSPLNGSSFIDGLTQQNQEGHAQQKKRTRRGRKVILIYLREFINRL